MWIKFNCHRLRYGNVLFFQSLSFLNFNLCTKKKKICYPMFQTSKQFVLYGCTCTSSQLMPNSTVKALPILGNYKIKSIQLHINTQIEDVVQNAG